MTKKDQKLIEIKDLVVEFNTEKGFVAAVNFVSLDVYKGRTLGIVGESGSGKTVLSLALMQLIPTPPGRISKGEILFEGRDLLKLNHSEMRKIRGNRLAMIFQEPMTSLNPVFTIGNQIEEVFKLHRPNLKKKERREQAIELLTLVGIPSPEARINDYPHQLSGGMRQRVMIAMGLACDPDILIADEPTTALDVTIQAQILDLMKKLQEELGMGIILITHDLGVVAETCDEVNVMYGGKIVESGSSQEIFKNPRHPYTQGLLDSIPSFDATKESKKEKLQTIPGIVPSLMDLPRGCPFFDRCSKKTKEVEALCEGKFPESVELGLEHKVYCHLLLKN